jgi:TIR domain
MALVFINYRTVDAAYGADAVAAQLAEYIGKEQVFLDHDSMYPGDDYPPMIRAALAGCKVLIAIIGPNWLSAADSGGVRLIHRQRDWVRREIADALADGIRVVPLLIRGAALPDREDLPGEIQRLTRMQARDLSFRELGKSARELVEELARTAPELLAPRLFEPDRTLGNRHLPSALLRAEYGIVPFQHRTDELTALRDWVQGKEPVSSMLLTAEGRQGKTRLALRLCHELRRSGWTAGMLAHDLPADVLSRIGELDVPLLVVIDYAEGRADRVIAAVQSVCTRKRREPARVLPLPGAPGSGRMRSPTPRTRRLRTCSPRPASSRSLPWFPATTGPRNSPARSQRSRRGTTQPRPESPCPATWTVRVTATPWTSTRRHSPGCWTSWSRMDADDLSGPTRCCGCCNTNACTGNGRQRPMN